MHTHKIAPGPRGYALLGSLLDIRRDRLRFLMDVTREFGDVVRFRMGPKTFHLINQPDGIKHVLQDNYRNYHKGIGLAQAEPLLGKGLLTSEGEFWLNQRRLMQPAFHPQRIMEFAPAITDATGSMLERWQTCAKHEQPLDISLEMMGVTLDILGRTLLGTDIYSEADAVGDAFALALKQAIRHMVAIFNLPESVPTPRNLRFRKALGTLDKVVYGMIDERRREEKGNGDLISTLLAHDDGTGKSVSDKQLRDEVMTILLAGHETTAMALTWTWYLLSLNPTVEHQLQRELSEVLGGCEPTFEALPNLKYAKMVFEEAIRLYPPVWLIPRTAVKDDEIGGYYIPAGSGVLVSPYSMHRNPEFWENPEVFDPERFSVEGWTNRPYYAYFPFGGGPRSCIGSSFGITEALLIIAMVAQRYRLRLVPGHPVKPEPLLTLRPRQGVLMTLQEVRA